MEGLATFQRSTLPDGMHGGSPDNDIGKVSLFEEKYHYSQKSTTPKLGSSYLLGTGESTLRYLEGNDFRFSNDSLEFKQYFSFESNNFYNEKNIRDFVLKHKLNDFLLWVNTPIADIFGDIKKSLKLVKCWDDEDYHIVLEVFSEQNNMDELSLLEDSLFKKLESHPEIDYALQYIVIAQR